MTLAPGVPLPAVAVGGPAVLAVEAGGLELAVGSGTVVRSELDGAAAPIPGGTAAALAAGSGVLAEPGSASTLRTAGPTPAVVLVLTVTPAVPTAGTPPATPPQQTAA